MKKFILLLSTAAAIAPAIAQYENNSIIFHPNEAANPGKHQILSERVGPVHNVTANKGTGGPKEGWFGYVDVMYKTGVSKGWYSNLYNDTTPRGFDASTSTYYHIKTHGTGFSFDPTSRVYDSAFNNVANVPGFSVMGGSTGNAYSIDSIFFNGNYARKSYNNYVDTMFFDLIKTGGTGTYHWTYGPSANLSDNAPDSTVRLYNAIYDADNNKMSDSIQSGYKISWYLPLTAAFYADSDANGNHGRNIKVPNGPLAVAAGEGVVLYTHFKSGHTYPFNMLIDSVNNWHAFSYEIDGASTTPQSVSHEKTSGLVSTWESRYAPYFTTQGHKQVISTFFYSASAGNDWPDYAFYVKCANCELSSVKNATGVIGSVNAYPNPATEKLNVTFSVAKSANVNVSLMNSMGQVIATKVNNVIANQTATATFETGNLASGIYFYSVEANGQKKTGNVTVIN